MPSYRKKPLAQLEHGTRIYAPSPNEVRYRVVAADPVSGQRIFVKCRTEDQARAKARELEQFIAQSAPIRDPQDAGPRSVERLAGRYINLCIKKVKHAGHGFRCFDHYRLCVLLHAGGVTWPQRHKPPRLRTRSPH